MKYLYLIIYEINIAIWDFKDNICDILKKQLPETHYLLNLRL